MQRPILLALLAPAAALHVGAAAAGLRIRAGAATSLDYLGQRLGIG